MIDPFLGEVGLHLSRPTQETQQVLQDIASAEDWEVEPRLQPFIDEVSEWCMETLQESFRPSEATRFAALAQEAGKFDTIRCEYHVEPYQLHISHTIYGMCVKVRTQDTIFVSDALKAVEQLAALIFAGFDQLHFSLEGPFENGSWGRRVDDPNELDDPEWPSWRDAMRWWTSPNEVNFITLKTEGGPTMEVIDIGEEFNRFWFSEQ